MDEAERSMEPFPTSHASPVTHPERLRGLRPSLARAWLIFRHRWLGRRYGRLVIETIAGLPEPIRDLSLIVLPDVFNPVLFRGGELLARTLAGPLFSPERFPAVLDLGCGAGVAAIVAARRGATVVAVDINPEAVRCTTLNALLNQVEDRVQALRSDLFAALGAERYDLVVFNPPFFRGRPKDDLDHAWRGEDVFERFAAGLGAHLMEEGEAWVLLSSDGAGAELLALLAAKGFTINVVAKRSWVNEIMIVYGVRPASIHE